MSISGILANCARCIGYGFVLSLVTEIALANNPGIRQQPSPEGETVVNADEEPPEWAKRRWIVKAYRVLTGREEGITTEQMNSWMPLSKDALVELFMADQGFEKQLISFGGYMMSGSLDSTKWTYAFSSNYGRYKDTKGLDVSYTRFNTDYGVFPFHWARSVLEDRNILTAIAPVRLRYLNSSYDPYLSSAEFPDIEPETITTAQARQLLLDRNLKLIEKYIAAIKALPEESSGSDLCQYWLQLEADDDFGIFNYGTSDFGNFDPSELRTRCFINPENITSQQIQNYLVTDITRHKAAVSLADSLHPKDYHPRGLLDLKYTSKDLGGDPLKPELHGTFDWFRSLTNSSTNFNRKRAASYLKRFFCDDLTPIDVVLPESDPTVHGKGGHASSPSCQACHYKLDPVAGMFRQLGYAGVHFGSDAQFFIFDDLRVLNSSETQDYFATWQDDSTPTGWNVGYVRSLTDLSKNDYADPNESPYEELFRLIQKSPEARTCMVKNMADFFVNVGQTFDGQFMRQVLAELEAEQFSGRGFKNGVKRLVLSKTFAQANPDPSQCYDEVDPENPVPCPIRHIVTKNCASCHVIQDFPLEDAAFRETMKERLTTSNSARRMPLNRLMSDQERVQLVKWLNEHP